MPSLRDSMYFGNRNYMQWVVPPVINYDASRAKKFSTAQYTNGGAYVRASATGSKHYVLSWNLKRRAELRPITDYSDGVYGVDQPVYFIDPFAYDTNLLPMYWAVPALGAEDAPQLAGTSDADRPQLIGTASNTLGLPSYSAIYSLKDNQKRNTIWLPVPPGHKLWLGAYGTSAGGNVSIAPTTGPTTQDATIDLPLMAVTDPSMFNFSLSGDQYTGGLLQITGGNNTSITLSGIMAQVLPNNINPVTDRWISGQGHSGCSFNDNPVLTQYSTALDRVGLSIDLIETDGWK